ncbi:hypothetical protein, partial [Escherichia coli]|uniref:hypothetical protein n=1 Tax=Escherichia coli TaxID=562 RepID=UPI001953E19A
SGTPPPLSILSPARYITVALKPIEGGRPYLPPRDGFAHPITVRQFAGAKACAGKIRGVNVITQPI